MAYNEALAQRIRVALGRHADFTERKMFGGICFLLNGNMVCGTSSEELMLRLGDEGAQAALRESNTREMDFTGRPLKSMIYVTPEGIVSDRDLESWVKRAADFVSSLPPKKAQAARSKAKSRSR